MIAMRFSGPPSSFPNFFFQLTPVQRVRQGTWAYPIWLLSHFCWYTFFFKSDAQITCLRSLTYQSQFPAHPHLFLLLLVVSDVADLSILFRSSFDIWSYFDFQSFVFLLSMLLRYFIRYHFISIDKKILLIYVLLLPATRLVRSEFDWISCALRTILIIMFMIHWRKYS